MQITNKGTVQSAGSSRAAVIESSLKYVVRGPNPHHPLEFFHVRVHAGVEKIPRHIPVLHHGTMGPWSEMPSRALQHVEGDV